MKPDERILNILREAVVQKYGCTPCGPTDFDRLSLSIYQITKRTISPSTLKRLWGYINDQSGTSISTLSLLCRYAGYRDWEDFQNHAGVFSSDNCCESGFSLGQILTCDTLPIGSRVRADWSGRKSCTVIKVANPRRFKVIESNNIKLQPDDLVTLDSIAISRPFVALDCMRGSQSLGNYIGAKDSGIKAFLISEK